MSGLSSLGDDVIRIVETRRVPEVMLVHILIEIQESKDHLPFSTDNSEHQKYLTFSVSEFHADFRDNT